MSFGVTAVVVAAGSLAYSAYEGHKARKAQEDAVNASIQQDAAARAQAEIDTQNASNAKIADAKRRRRASSLLTTSSDTLGGPDNALGAGVAGYGAYAPASTAGRASTGGGTALGAGISAGTAATAPVSTTRANY
jgi:hypothetical protein